MECGNVMLTFPNAYLIVMLLSFFVPMIIELSSLIISSSLLVNLLDDH